MAAAPAAHATAYAYGTIGFTNVVLSGLGASNVTTSNITVQARDSSNFPGAANSANSNSSTNLTSGVEVTQAFSGLGTAPAENTFSQALTAGNATRGDSQITGSLFSGATTADVAEGRLTSTGNASSTAGTTTGFNVTVNVATGTTANFSLSFNASDNLFSSVTAAGDSAAAEVNASFTIRDTASNNTITQFAPGQLNTNVTATVPGQNGTFTLPSTAFTTGNISLGAGTYQFSLLSGAQEQISVGAVNVPEPASLALLSAGLLGLGLARRRRVI